jgi:hypothetical protein
MIYRLVSRAAAPFAPMLLARRAKRGKNIVNVSPNGAAKAASHGRTDH